MIEFVKKNIKLSLLLLALTSIVYYYFTRDLPIKDIDKNSPHYVNNLYFGEDYVYNRLPEDEQKAYDIILKNLKNSNNTVKVSASEFGCDYEDNCSSLLAELYDAIAVDQPALINFATYRWIINGDDLTIKFTNAAPLKLLTDIGMLRIERIIDEINRKTKTMSDAEKILYVYEWIGDHARYDTLFTFASKNQSIYNVFIKHNAVCAGFSKTATVIFQNIGIEAYSVTGFMDASHNIGHMWNIIKHQDKYYFFDSTWAASRRNKSLEDYYFGLFPPEMDSYILDHPEWYPDVSFDMIPGVLN